MEKLLKNFDKFLKYYKSNYEFKICPLSAIDSVVEFINTYWKQDHALVKSRSLLDWQHLDKREERYTFSYAIHKKTEEIHALIGLIPSTQFDPEIKKRIVWGAIWKVRDDVAADGLGVMVRLYGNIHIPGYAKGGLSLSKDATSVLGHYKYANGICNHYYMINPEDSRYELIGNIEETIPTRTAAIDPTKKFIFLTEEDFLSIVDEKNTAIPFYKSKTYYLNRFFKHPIYTYHATLIVGSDKKQLGVFFWRVCKHNNARCIRIVDMFMQPGALKGNRLNFTDLLIEQNAEFIDCYNFGYDESEFYSAGFSERHQSKIIIPNYFEPFSQTNCEMNYSYDCNDKNQKILFFKGDADQDRPNRVSNE